MRMSTCAPSSNCSTSSLPAAPPWAAPAASAHTVRAPANAHSHTCPPARTRRHGRPSETRLLARAARSIRGRRSSGKQAGGERSRCTQLQPRASAVGTHLLQDFLCDGRRQCRGPARRNALHACDVGNAPRLVNRGTIGHAPRLVNRGTRARPSSPAANCGPRTAATRPSAPMSPRSRRPLACLYLNDYHCGSTGRTAFNVFLRFARE